MRLSDLYPLDLERATTKLDTIKDDFVFWSSGAESQELIGSGEVAMTLIWNGRGWSAKHIDKKPVEIQWNQQIVTADYLVVPKGSPNKDAAMKFIAYAACAANNGKPSEFIPYGPTNTNSTGHPRNVKDLAGHECRRELGLLRRRIPDRQLRRDQLRVAGLEGGNNR